MFLKGSFYFPSRSNMRSGSQGIFIVKIAKSYAVRAGGLLAGIWILQNAAQLIRKKICNGCEFNY